MSDRKRFRVLIEVQQPDGSWSQKLSQEDYDTIFRTCCPEAADPAQRGVQISSTQELKEMDLYYLGKEYDVAEKAQEEIEDVFRSWLDVNEDIDNDDEDTPDYLSKYRWFVIDQETSKRVYPWSWDSAEQAWKNPEGETVERPRKSLA